MVCAEVAAAPRDDSDGINNHMSTSLVSELNRRNIAADHSSSFRDDHHSANAAIGNGVDQQRGYFTLPGRRGGGGNKKSPVAPANADSIPLLPFHQTPPPDHPPPPPPPPQASGGSKKSADYATVATSPSPSANGPAAAKASPTNSAASSNSSTGSGGIRSSFKPSDNAKLYASPENVQPLAFRAGEQQQQQQQTKKVRSPTRANSMPPRPNRPQVLRRSMIAEVPLTGSSAAAAGAGAAPAVGAGKETYSVNGVSYTTYTTFRSPITPDEVPESASVSGRRLSFDGGDQLTPTNNEEQQSSLLPDIPEPDYDVSDAEGEREMRRRATATKKKSVTFVMNEEEAAAVAAAAAAAGANGRNGKKPESILKDPSTSSSSTSREREREYAAQQQQRQAAIALASDPDRCFERIPHARLAQQQQQQQAQPVAAPAGEKKVRIAIAQNGVKTPNSASASLARSNSVASASASTCRNGTSLQKSRSFSADKCQADPRVARSSNRSSYQQELVGEEGENSSSGVSSDQETNGNNGQRPPPQGAASGGTSVEVRYVTRLPVEGPPRSEVVTVEEKAPSESSGDDSTSWLADINVSKQVGNK